MCMSNRHTAKLAGERKAEFVSISVCANELWMPALDILVSSSLGGGGFCFMEGHSRHCTLPIQKLETKTESIETEVVSAPPSQPPSTEKVLQETGVVEDRRVMNVQGSGDASHTAGDDVDAAESTPMDPHSIKGTEAAKEDRGEVADKSVSEQEQPATGSHEEEQVEATHPSEALEQKSHFEVNGSY